MFHFMKKIFLVFLLSFISSQGLTKVGDVYYCDMKQNMMISIDSTNDDKIYGLHTFKFKWEKDNIKIISEGEWFGQIPQDSLFHRIIYSDNEIPLEDGTTFERFAAQDDFTTMIYADNNLFMVGQGELKSGWNTPIMTQVQTAICNKY